MIKEEVICDQCDEQFIIITENEIKQIEFCPFCGGDIDDDELDDFNLSQE